MKGARHAATAEIAGELERRAELRRALRSLLAHCPGNVVTLPALRLHLRKYAGAKVAATPETDFVAAGLTVRAGVALHVALRKPNMANLVNGWERKITISPEPAGQRWRHEKLNAETLAAAEPGTMYRSHDGVHRQSYDSALTAVADTKNPDGTRGRGRRFMPYLAALRQYLSRPLRLPQFDREVLEMVVAGESVRWIARHLDTRRFRVQQTIRYHQEQAGIKGPGPGGGIKGKGPGPGW